jgi:hypothetical protein
MNVLGTPLLQKLQLANEGLKPVAIAVDLQLIRAILAHRFR